MPGFSLQIGSILQGHTLKFISLPIAEIDSQVDLLLGDLCKIASADTARLYLMNRNLNELSLARLAKRASARGVPPLGEAITEPNWFFDQAKVCGVVYLNEEDAEAQEPHRVRKALQALKCNNFLAVPVLYEGEPRGLVAIAREDKTIWTLDHLDALEQASDIVFHVWLRKIAQAHEPVQREARELYVERWKSFLEHSPDTVAVIDPEGRISDINRMSLLPKQEVLGQHFFDFMPQTEQSNLQIRLDTVFEDHQSMVYESKVVEDDGSVRWYCNRMSPLFRNDRVVNALLVSTDITDQKAAENAVRDSLTDKLEHSEKMRAVGRLAGGIAHSFNNLFWIIGGNLELLKRSGGADAGQERRLDDMASAVSRAEVMIEQLLYFSRHRNRASRPTLVEPLFRKWGELLEEIYPDTLDVEFVVDADVRQLIVDVDIQQVKHAFLNLVQNAAEAMKLRGLLRIELSTLAFQQEEPAKVCLKIIDTGPGLTASLSERVFEPFFTTKSRSDGVGLGLSTALGIVEENGGALRLESEEGRGVTALMEFPVCSKLTDTKYSDASWGAVKKGRILVVDDEPSVAELLDSQLVALGHDAAALTDPMKALSVFEQDPTGFDLAILDEGLSGVTGTELAGKLLRHNAKLPIVLMTGFSATVARLDLKKYGIRRLLFKPVAFEELNCVIEEALGATSAPSKSA